MSEALDQNLLNQQPSQDGSNAGKGFCNTGSPKTPKVSTAPRISAIPEIPVIPARKTTGNNEFTALPVKTANPVKPVANPNLAKVTLKQSPPSTAPVSNTSPTNSSSSTTATGQSPKVVRGVPPPVPPSRTNSKRADGISLPSEPSFKKEISDTKFSDVAKEVAAGNYRSSSPPIQRTAIYKPVATKKLSFHIDNKQSSKFDSFSEDNAAVIQQSASPNDLNTLDQTHSKPIRGKSDSSSSLAKTIAQKHQSASKDSAVDKNLVQTLSGLKMELTRQLSSSNPGLAKPTPEPILKSDSGSRLSSMLTTPPVLKSDSAPSITQKSDPSTPNLKKSNDSLSVGAASKRSTVDLPTLRKTHSINLSDTIHTANTIRVKSIDSEISEKVLAYIDGFRETNDDLVLSPVSDALVIPKPMTQAPTSFRNDSNAHQFTVIRKAGSQGSLSSVATQQAEIISPFKKIGQSVSLESLLNMSMMDDEDVADGPTTPKEKKAPPFVPPRKIATVKGAGSPGNVESVNTVKQESGAEDVGINRNGTVQKQDILSKPEVLNTADVDLSESDKTSKNSTVKSDHSNLTTEAPIPNTTSSNSFPKYQAPPLKQIITSKTDLSKSLLKVNSELVPKSANYGSNHSIPSIHGASLKKAASFQTLTQTSNRILQPSQSNSQLLSQPSLGNQKQIHTHQIYQSFLVNQSFYILSTTLSRHLYKFHFDRIATSLMTYCLNLIRKNIT